MLEIASQMILCLLLAALLGFIMGYFFGKSTCDNNNCDHKEELNHKNTHDSHETQKSVSTVVSSSNSSEEIEKISIEDEKPTLLSAPRNGEKDNLTRIKGIGLKIEAALNEIGIYHFDQIATWNKENIAWADSTLGFPGRAEREQWVTQAKALAVGEETEFSKRVDAGKVSSSKQA